MKVRSTATAVCVCGPKKVKLVKHGLYTTNGKPNPLINNNILFWGKMGKSGEALGERPSLLGQLVKQVKNELYLSIAITKLLINKDIVLWGAGNTFLQKVRAESFTCFTASPKAVARQKTVLHRSNQSNLTITKEIDDGRYN